MFMPWPVLILAHVSFALGGSDRVPVVAAPAMPAYNGHLRAA